MFICTIVLEVYQFARDAAVAEAWLIAQEPYLMSQELGHTIDEVENLIKKHEAFEKSAAAQEDRFSALERLTTVSFYFVYWVMVLASFCTMMFRISYFFNFQMLLTRIQKNAIILTED